MKIAKIEAIELEIPFSRGVEAATAKGVIDWPKLDFCVVRVVTDEGLVGWGDAFSYRVRKAVAGAVEHTVAPLLIGRDVADIARITYELQQKLHIFGRYGVTMFAIAGVEIALWDIAARRAGLPLYRLLGGAGTARVPGYASFPSYGDPAIVKDRVKAAVAAGYRAIKLHETGLAEVAAAREAAGPDIDIMVDVNCPWTPAEARAAARAMAEYDILWLEEPVFPPEDFASLAAIRRETGVAIAAGENCGAAFQFQQMLEAGAVDYAQPSVAKVGGIGEFRKVAALAEAHGVQLMPHSPYFGPGFLATLHLAQSLSHPGMIERFYLFPEAELYPGLADPAGGFFGCPDLPGLGPEPDPHVLGDYRVR